MPRPDALLALLICSACVATEAPVPAATPPRPETAAPAVQPIPVAPAGFAAALRTAVLRAPDLAATSAALRGSEAGVRAERAALFPQLGLVAGVQSGGGGSYAKLSQIVFDAGATRGLIAASEARVTARHHDRTAGAAALALAAVEVWAAVRLTRDLEKLALENLSIHHDYVDHVHQRLAGGVTTEAELLAAESRRDGAEAALAQAEGDRRAADLAFQERFGHPPAAGLSPVPRAPVAGDPMANAQSSPRLAALQAEERAADAALKAALAGRWPRVVASVTADSDDTRGGVALEYDVLGHGRRQAAIDEAVAVRDHSRAAREGLEASLTRVLGQAASDIRAGEVRLAAATRAASATARARDAVAEQLGSGRSRIIELLDAQRDHHAAEQGRLIAAQDLLLAGYALLAASGAILPHLGLGPALDAS